MQRFIHWTWLHWLYINLVLFFIEEFHIETIPFAGMEGNTKEIKCMVCSNFSSINLWREVSNLGSRKLIQCSHKGYMLIFDIMWFPIINCLNVKSKSRRIIFISLHAVDRMANVGLRLTLANCIKLKFVFFLFSLIYKSLHCLM